MSIHLQRELESLRKRLLSVSALVESQLSKALRALLQRQPELAQEVMDADTEIDRLEIEVEEECLKILALDQPVAHDLRFLVAALKMNNDMERMGDHAAHIAQRAAYLCKREPLAWPDGIETMGNDVKLMVKHSLDALIEGDARLAREVCARDSIIDEQKSQIIKTLRERLKDPQIDFNALLKMIDVPRQLERIADLATNIAEDVVYMVDGRIMRHHSDEEAAE